jgi:serine protease Do
MSARRTVAVALVPLAAAAFVWGQSEGLRAQEDPRPPARPAAALSHSYARAVMRAAPALVAIRPAGDSPAKRRRGRSGVCIAPGFVLTATHNVDVFGVDDLVVEDHEGRVHAARLRGRDLRLRLVLLAAPTLRPKLPPRAPESTRRAGSFVLALGSPLRRRGVPSATGGILSAPGRFQGRADQVDTPTDESNIGGLIVDLEGRSLGVVVQVHRRLGQRSGVGFAVPLSVVDPVLLALRAGRELEPATLGIHVPRVHSGGDSGVEVISATGAAARAGLARGDRILALNGLATADLITFRRAAALLYAGQRVRLRILREGQERTLELVALPRH